MPRKPGELLQGTLDMLILKTLTAGPMHGYAIVRRLQQVSDDALVVEEGSLYPALYRMAAKDWIEAEWGTSENNRRAKFYRLTPAGERQLENEVAFWERFTAATAKVLQLSPTEG
jgi:transcriptional regulator